MERKPNFDDTERWVGNDNYLNIFKVSKEWAARWRCTSWLGRTVLLLNPESIEHKRTTAMFTLSCHIVLPYFLYHLVENETHTHHATYKRTECYFSYGFSISSFSSGYSNLLVLV